MRALASFVTRSRVTAALAAVAALAAMAALCAAPARPALPQTGAQWREAARQDIDEALRLMRENHPGAYDPANPAFLANLEKAGQRALALAARVDGPATYLAAIDAFDAALGDGHALIAPEFDAGAQITRRWPGFVTVWREAGLFVYASEPGGPPAGAQVLACDGKPVRQVIADKVFSFEGRSNEAGRWWSRAYLLFVDAGNPFIELPQRCRFVHEGKTFEQDLTWRPLTEQASTWLKDSYNGQTLPVGLTEPRKGLFWVAMPTFDPDEAQREAYRAMVSQVESGRQRFLEADAIVIDLRQNHGGSSTWSYAFAGALWGEDRVKRRMEAIEAKTETWWRASRDNTRYVRSLIRRYIDEKRPDDVEWAQENSAGMRAALARGDKYYVEKEDPPAVTLEDSGKDLPTDPPPFTRPVYVIVPGQCASACLDALDTFTLFPNTILIGAPSSADSTYMEVRRQKLRSGLGSVIIPNKMYVNRPRANGQVYLPAIYVNDLDWSLETFRRVVEQDLVRRAAPLSAGAGSAARSAPTPH
jgi:hypothetical protein